MKEYKLNRGILGERVYQKQLTQQPLLRKAKLYYVDIEGRSGYWHLLLIEVETSQTLRQAVVGDSIESWAFSEEAMVRFARENNLLIVD